VKKFVDGFAGRKYGAISTGRGEAEDESTLEGAF